MRKEAVVDLPDAHACVVRQVKAIPVLTSTYRWDGQRFVLIAFNDASYELTSGAVAGYVGMTAEEIHLARLDLQPNRAESQGILEMGIVYAPIAMQPSLDLHVVGDPGLQVIWNLMSNAGRGATFGVLLPLMSRDAAGDREMRRPYIETPALADDSVAVDDEDDSRELIAELLRQAGATVHACASAKEALALRRRAPVSVLLTDIAMPGTGGIALVERLRAEAGARAVPAIAVTG